jgi:hypothetical protein
LYQVYLGIRELNKDQLHQEPGYLFLNFHFIDLFLNKGEDKGSGNQLYLYFYDPLSSFSTHISYPPQQFNHCHINTK